MRVIAPAHKIRQGASEVVYVYEDRRGYKRRGYKSREEKGAMRVIAPAHKRRQGASGW